MGKGHDVVSDGRILAFGLSQLRGEFAWVVPLAIAVVGYWLERRQAESRRRVGLAALLIVAGSVVTEVIVRGFAFALSG